MTPGIHCDVTLAHAAVNAGAETGFHLATERGRKEVVSTRRRRGGAEHTATGGSVFADFGGGPREWRLKVRFEPHAVDYRQAAASGGTLARLREYYALLGAELALRTSAAETYTVRFVALEEHTHPPAPGAAAVVVLVEAV